MGSAAKRKAFPSDRLACRRTAPSCPETNGGKLVAWRGEASATQRNQYGERRRLSRKQCGISARFSGFRGNRDSDRDTDRQQRRPRRSSCVNYERRCTTLKGSVREVPLVRN